MTRLFGRGELKVAILAALTDLGPANGYAVMQALADAIGGPWQPSPGAIYPALLALEDAGLLTGVDDGAGSRTYSLTPAGRAEGERAAGTLSAVAARAQSTVTQVTLGSLLDAFATGATGRSRRLDPDTAQRVGELLGRTDASLTEIFDKEHHDG